MASLRRSGTFCWFGPVLGAPQSLELMQLPKSIKIGDAVFLDHIHTPSLFRERTAALFGLVGSRDLKVKIGAEYAWRGRRAGASAYGKQKQRRKAAPHSLVVRSRSRLLH